MVAEMGSQAHSPRPLSLSLTTRPNPRGVPRWLSPVRRESGKLVAQYASGVQTPGAVDPPRGKISPSAPLPSRRGSEAMRMPVRDRQTTPTLLQIDAILTRLKGAAALSEVCRFLRHEFRHYRWVGIYRLEGTTLILEGWNGEAATEHTRIPLAQGICGRAAREGRTVIIDDVRTAPEYLSCFLETRSEIVVPIRSPSEILGEIDIDGTEVQAYDESDRRFLEQVAEKLTAPLALVASSSPASPSGP